jgi:pimeloyl-ACP methyl ester carboxylesterase
MSKILLTDENVAHDLVTEVLMFDYRGYGRSEGVPTVEGILQDARAARILLAHRAAVPEVQIVLMGRSLGGAVVVQLAAETPARGLILESSFSSLKDVATHQAAGPPSPGRCSPTPHLDDQAQSAPLAVA